jgi:hypothetical protein
MIKPGVRITDTNMWRNLRNKVKYSQISSYQIESQLMDIIEIMDRRIVMLEKGQAGCINLGEKSHVEVDKELPR